MIAIVDYKAGNLTSVARALEYLGHRCEITDRPERVRSADRAILPGVGAAGATMENLRALGLDEVLRNDVARAGKPFLGICIGIQVLLDRSEEDDAHCLGIIAGHVTRFPAAVDGRPLKVPQIGWNRVRQTQPHPVFRGVPDNTHFYFVNSYYPIPDDPALVIATSDHGVPFCAAIARDNVVATQFHLEKSGAAGLRLLDNFCRLKLSAVIAKRIIPCLDVRAGKVTKGVQFLDNADVGDPVAMARYYYEQGADELVFYDITASNEQRGIMIDVVRAVAREIFIPFSVGGGLRTLEDMRAVLLAGAEKVSIDSGAVRDPSLIAAGARAFGSQCVVLSMQVKRTGRAGLPSGHEVIIDGGRTPTGRDAFAWAREGERLGAGELCINSIDADGTKAGYELEITRMIADGVGIPVIASGGAGEPRHLLDAFTAGGADAAIVASIVHYGECTIPELKRYLRAGGVEIREAIHLDFRDQGKERSGT